MKKSISIFGMLVIILLVFFGLGNKYPDNTSYDLTNDFVGTYSSKDDLVYISFWSGDGSNRFYYTDNRRNVYIKGTFEKQIDEQYAIVSDALESKTIIPDQSIECKNKKFTMIVGPEKVDFTKTNQLPILLNDEDFYE